MTSYQTKKGNYIDVKHWYASRSSLPVIFHHLELVLYQKSTTGNRKEFQSRTVHHMEMTRCMHADMSFIIYRHSLPSRTTISGEQTSRVLLVCWKYSCLADADGSVARMMCKSNFERHETEYRVCIAHFLLELIPFRNLHHFQASRPQGGSQGSRSSNF